MADGRLRRTRRREAILLAGLLAGMASAELVKQAAVSDAMPGRSALSL